MTYEETRIATVPTRLALAELYDHGFEGVVVGGALVCEGETICLTDGGSVPARVVLDWLGY